MNPKLVRDFTQVTDCLAKTDRVDAQVLAHSGEAIRLPLRSLPDALISRSLCALVARRRQLVGMKKAEQRRRLARSKRDECPLAERVHSPMHAGLINSANR